ncbi:MAG: GNAT family N-acetyltransferase [Bacteroidetes bacterium]|nr:GNAT family N-acetyltransferase [Bacteroidota bacterium]
MLNNRQYKCLYKQEFSINNYSLVPIRHNDNEEIRNWRNDQMDLLRQSTILTKEDQINYFETVVANLFVEENPKQLLFSLLYNEKLVGYGGLVHIDWINKNAEISFLTSKERSNNPNTFEQDWLNYLDLIKRVANHINFIKIYTYAYSIRTNLFPIIEKSGFEREAVLKNHVIINKHKKHVFIHSFFCDEIYYRKASKDDLKIYFKWANDTEVRKNSFNSDKISIENHTKWFLNKVVDEKTLMLVYFNSKNELIGQARIEEKENETIIGVSVNNEHREMGYANRIIFNASKHFKLLKDKSITAYIKKDNIASIKAFKNAGYKFTSNEIIQGHESIKLIFT